LKKEVSKLNEAVDELSKVKKDLEHNVKQMGEQNDKLKSGVEAFQEQNKKLSEQTDKLRGENKNLKENVDKLGNIVEDLNSVKSTIEAYAKENNSNLGDIIAQMNKNLQDQKQVLNDQKEIMNQTLEITKTQERVLLNQLQQQLTAMNAMMGMQDGLNKEQFENFMAMVPSMTNLTCSKTFEEIDTSGDGTIDFEEFQKLVDAILAESHK